MIFSYVCLENRKTELWKTLEMQRKGATVNNFLIFWIIYLFSIKMAVALR